MKPRALVTGAGGPAGRALIAQLRNRGIPVLGTDTRALTPVDGVTMVQVPAASDPELMSVLRRLVADESISLVIPTVSEELPQIAAFYPAFGPDVRVIIGDPGPVALANDKLYTAWSLHSAGVPIPRFGVPQDFPDAAAAFEALGSPLIVKPRVSRGGRGVLVIEEGADVDWHGLPEGQIVQEFIPGTEYGPMVFGAPTDGGPGSFVVVVEKTELAAGMVGNAVATRRAETGSAMDVGDVAMAAVHALGLTGPIDVDVRRRADGTPVVLEVNARFGANSQAAPELLAAVLDPCALPSVNPSPVSHETGAFADALV